MDYTLEVVRWNDTDGPSIREVMAVHGNFENAAQDIAIDFNLDPFDRIIFKAMDGTVVYDSFNP